MQIWWFDIDWLLWLFQNISPYYWSGLGIALCVGLSIIGAAWWVFLRSYRARGILKRILHGFKDLAIVKGCGSWAGFGCY